MIQILDCICGKRREGNTEFCASCNAEVRKAERRKLTVKKPIKKVSDKKRNEIDQYVVLRQAFLLRKWCAVHGKPCIPTEVHHQKGRAGYCDEIGKDQGIPALIDIRYWIPVCHEAHECITQNSNEAIKEGYSFLRSNSTTKETI